jgi:hypothetical protein
MNTPTPRTDAYEYKAGWAAANYGEPWKPMDFARELERELAALAAERDRWQEIAKAASAEREHNANVAQAMTAERDQLRAELERTDVIYQRACEVEHQLRAEVERCNDIINRASVQFFHDGTDGETAAKMLTVLNEAKP